MSSSQLIEYGSHGTTYWAQATCQECGAWLSQMPQRSAVVIPRVEGENPLYLYLWICDHCKRIRMVESFSSPDEYSPLPKSEVHKPGSYPPPILRDPLQWDNGYMLTPAARKLVVACWEMMDDMKRIRGLIHQIGYLWNLRDMLEAYDIEAVVESARAYVELIDYEEIHGKNSTSYGGQVIPMGYVKEALEKVDKKGIFISDRKSTPGKKNKNRNH